jgi:hypothetical protein
MRGNAQQLMEKFLAMARDATSSGDRVLAENYFQHADHYYRVLNARFEQQGGQQNNNQQNNGQRPYQGGNDRGYEGDDQGQSDQGYHPQQAQQPQNQSYQPQQQQPQQNHQPQAYTQAPQQHPQPQHQPQPEPQDTDIGLPPGILGIAPEVSSQGEQVEAEQAEGAEPRARQQGRRRRGPRERPPADAGAE